jgi:nitrous oxidase accessory protein
MAAMMLVVGLYFHRRAYKPLVEARAAVVAAVLGIAGAAGAAPFDLPAAIAAAPSGAVIEVPAGTCRGPIVIDKPLVLVAAPGAILDGGGEGNVVTIIAPGVTLRGFTIRATGISLDRENTGIAVSASRAVIEDNVLEDVLFGIYLRGAEDSVVRGNTIGGKDLPVQRRGDAIRIWQSHRTLIENNTVRDSRDVVMWFSEDVVIRANHISHGRYGLHFMYTDRNVMEDNRLEDNSVGAFLMYSRGLTLRRNVFARNRGPSGYGVGLKDMDGVTAQDNLFAGNRVGLQLDNSPSSLRVHDLFERNVFACNDVGIAFMPAVKRNGFRDNCFIENLEQVAILGGGTFEGNDFTVEGRGNFWSDYRGWDQDGDGIGDLPYRAESLFENLMDRDPRLRLFLFSPAQQAVELAARAFPVVAPQPKLTDTAPLTRLPSIDLRLPPGAGSWPLLAESAALLAAGGAAWGAGRLRPGRSALAAMMRRTCQ